MNEKLNNVIIKIEPINSKDNIDNSMENINDVIKSLNENKYVSDIIFSYNIHNHTKYAQFEMLAIDKVCGGGKKLYLGFKTKADKIKFIQSYKYKNLYEIIINEIVKPYFDIDYKKPQEYKTDEEVKIILHAFIIEFNKFFRLPITSDNIYCYAKRDDDTNLIKSIHIVISGFKATKDAMKEMVNAINKQRKPNSFKKMVGGLDGKVYGLRRLFSLPHQTKIGKTEFFEWFKCFDNDESKYGDDAIYHYVINDVGGCVFNDYHDNPIKYAEITEQKLNDEEEAIEKINKIITNDEMINLNPLNVVDKLLEHLPQEFYDGDGWKHISRQIVLNKWNGYDKWLRESVEKSPNYDYDKNIAWADKLDDKYATTDITKHLNLINIEHNKCFIWDKSGYFTQSLMDWICKIANINESDLKASIKIFNENEAKSKKSIPTNDILVGNNYVFNIKKQTIINEITQSINHFGMETKFNNQYGIDETKFKTIKQDEIIDEMNVFLKSIHRISGWKMLWGSGKTYYGVKTIKKYATDNDLRILFLTPNTNLNIEMTANLGGISHLDIISGKYKKEDVMNSPILISSLESLYSTIDYNGKTPIDIIICDEYESLINNFTSNTFKKKTSGEVSDLLSVLLRDANKIICLDCDLSEIRMNIIKNKILEDDNDDSEIKLFRCDYNSWENYKYIIHTGIKPMRQSLYSDVFDKKKRILYSTNSINDAKTIYKELCRKSRKEAIHKNIMLISSDGVEYVVNGVEYNDDIVKDWKKDLKDDNTKEQLIKLNKNIDIGKYANKTKKELFENTEQTLKELQIECLIYSPSMTCGISFGNSKTDFMFDKLYGSSSIGSITAREFLQMIHRCRNLHDREINLFIKNGLTAITPFISLDACEMIFIRHELLKMRDKNDKKDDWWGEIEYDKFKEDTFYRDIIVSDLFEKLNSERNYIQELLGKLIVNHDLNVSLKHIFKLNDGDDNTLFKEDYDEIKKLVNADKKMLLQQEVKITESQYKHFKDDMNKNDGVDNRHKVNKFFILKCLNINNPNNEILINNKDKIQEQQEDGYWCEYEKENGEVVKQAWKLKSDTYGASSGTFTNNVIDADGEVYYFNNHKVNKYFIEKDEQRQDGFWCVFKNVNGEIVKREWKLKSVIYTSNGLFKNHKLDGDDTIYYYGGECSYDEDEINDSNYVDKYCELEEIQVEQYDKDLLIQHSKKLTEIYKSPFMKRLCRLNNEILVDNKCDDEKKTAHLNTKDFNLNQLSIIKKIINMLGINRKDLIFTRKIIQNKELKQIFQDKALFIQNELLTYYNDGLDTKKINNKKQEIKNYNSSNDKHFKYVKNIITTYMEWIGISHNHYNKHGKRGLYVLNDDCFVVFQYEIFDSLLDYKLRPIKRTFINTYYDTISNEIYYYLYKTQKAIHETINKKTLDENLMANSKASDWYKRSDKKFQERRNIFYKRNRYITITIEDKERQLKLPFNLLTADYIVDKNGIIIHLKDKTNEERIDIYVKLKQDDYIFPIQHYTMENYNKRTEDTRLSIYNDIGWNNNKNKEIYVKEQVVKYTTDKTKKDNIIQVKSQTTEDIVNDVLNEIIDGVVMKDEFKRMVNNEINVGGEVELIREAHDKLIREEIDTSITNSNDNHFNILRPNIKLNNNDIDEIIKKELRPNYIKSY